MASFPDTRDYLVLDENGEVWNRPTTIAATAKMQGTRPKLIAEREAKTMNDEASVELPGYEGYRALPIDHPDAKLALEKLAEADNPPGSHRYFIQVDWMNGREQYGVDKFIVQADTDADAFRKAEAQAERSHYNDDRIPDRHRVLDILDIKPNPAAGPAPSPADGSAPIYFVGMCYPQIDMAFRSSCPSGGLPYVRLDELDGEKLARLTDRSLYRLDAGSDVAVRVGRTRCGSVVQGLVRLTPFRVRLDPALLADLRKAEQQVRAATARSQANDIDEAPTP